MFDFGFRPWGDVIGDVGNQVKEQINRYHQNRLQEQLLQRQDNQAAAGRAREDSLDARDWSRKLGMIDDQRQYAEQQANAPVDSDLSSFIRDLMNNDGGKTPPVTSEVGMDPNARVVGVPLPTEPEYGGYNAFNAGRNAGNSKRPMSQREYDNAMQAAPFFKATHAGAGGNGLTFEQRMQLLETGIDGRKAVTEMAEGGKTSRLGTAEGGRNYRQGKDQTFKGSEGDKNRDNRIVVEGMRQKTKMELAEYNKNFSGLSDREKNLVSELNKLEDQLTQLTSRDVAVVKGADWRAQVEETKKKIDSSMTELKAFRKGNTPVPKTGSSSVKKVDAVVPQNPAKTITYSVNGVPKTVPWSKDYVDKLNAAKVPFKEQ